MPTSDDGTLSHKAGGRKAPEDSLQPAQTNGDGDGLCKTSLGDVNSQVLTSELTASAGLDVPAYVIHPADLPLISQAAASMHLSVIDYVQLAPYLYACLYQRRSNIANMDSADAFAVRLPRR